MNTAEQIELQQWTELGSPDKIPKLGSRVVETARGPVAVFKNGDGELFALLNRCPHQGGPLSEGIVHGRLVTCPLHSWHIQLDRGEAKAPDRGCVPRFPVKVERGTVYLGLVPLLPDADAGSRVTKKT